MVTVDIESIYPIKHLIFLAIFAGFVFWTCSFVSDIIVGVFRNGFDYLPRATRIIIVYIAGGFALATILVGIVWLAVQVLGMPTELLGSISYTQIALVAVFVGITVTTTQILLPNLFLQEHKNDK